MPASLLTQNTLAGREKHTSSSVLLAFMDGIAWSLWQHNLR